MMPGEPQSEAMARTAESAGDPPAAYRWYHKALAIALATFCLEMGCFLLFFPWTSWSSDFAAFKPAWEPYWNHVYVRIGISALGLANLYIALIEIFRLRRFAKR